jgi:hypothetical protein
LAIQMMGINHHDLVVYDGLVDTVPKNRQPPHQQRKQPGSSMPIKPTTSPTQPVQEAAAHYDMHGSQGDGARAVARNRTLAEGFTVLHLGH